MERLQVKPARRGLHVVVNDNHIKTIPSKFAGVVRKKHIINPLRKRLTREERFLLEVSLFEKKLKQENRFAYDYVKRSVPKLCRQISTQHGNYFELLYKNNMAIRVNGWLYDLAPEKTEIHRNY